MCFFNLMVWSITSVTEGCLSSTQNLWISCIARPTAMKFMPFSISCARYISYCGMFTTWLRIRQSIASMEYFCCSLLSIIHLEYKVKILMGPSWSYGSWIYNYLCNQCLSPLKLWVWTPFMVRCTRYNIMWWSLSVTCDSTVVFFFSGFLH